MNKDFNHSYWEIKTYFRTYDLVVIGSGIVGLSIAISYKQKHKQAKVLILERGILASGASTKNAGFACFGSATELLDDLKNTSEALVWQTVKMRWEGLALLKKRIGIKNMAFKAFGGYELFFDQGSFQKCLEQIENLNKNVYKNIGLKNCYSPTKKHIKDLKGVSGIVHNPYEGQIDTGMMMLHLLKLAKQLDIRILNGIEVKTIEDLGVTVRILSDFGEFSTRQLVVATNGFAKQLLKIEDVKPARAQVLVTSPIPNLKLKGSFHFDKGYYYFRNIDNRILFGGGRNLDFKTEQTFDFGLNPIIQDQLDHYLKELILPGTEYTVEQRWSGIMGIGDEKAPIIKKVSSNVLAVVRMGGMGIAIGSKVGEMAANKLS